jgi:hypothetical protein
MSAIIPPAPLLGKLFPKKRAPEARADLAHIPFHRPDREMASPADPSHTSHLLFSSYEMLTLFLRNARKVETEHPLPSEVKRS